MSNIIPRVTTHTHTHTKLSKIPEKSIEDTKTQATKENRSAGRYQNLKLLCFKGYPHTLLMRLSNSAAPFGNSLAVPQKV